MQMGSGYIWKGIFKGKAYCAGANCVCAVEWPNMPWRSLPAFHQSLLRIEPQKWGWGVCGLKGKRDLRSMAFPLTSHRQKRWKACLFSWTHRLQLGHVSCLEPGEQALEEGTIGDLTSERRRLWATQLYLSVPNSHFSLSAPTLCLAFPLSLAPALPLSLVYGFKAKWHVVRKRAMHCQGQL